jgi:phosphate-selective porin OprO and OprP
MTRSWMAAVLATALASPAAAQAPLLAPAAPVVLAAAAPRGDVKAQVFPTPRVRIGKAFSIELIAKLQVDVSRFDPVVDDDDEDLDWRRRRLGVKGELFNRLEFEVEREFGDDDDPWRDVFVNFKAADTFALKAGHFRVPFSLDGLTGSTGHDFVNRSLGGSLIAPGRDRGLMVHGRTDGRVFTYALGVFDSDDAVDEVSAFFDDEKGAASQGRTVGGRLTAQPFDRLDRLPRGLRNLEFGGNATWSSVPEGLNGFEGRSVYRYTFFEPVYVKGDRVRAGVDAVFRAGPTSVKAEWMRMWDDRRAQGLGDADLPKAVARAWYVAGTWLVTGETKDDGVRPTRPFLQGGLGALEAAVRIERLSVGSVSSGGEPAFANPRAANLLGNHDDVVTLGLTWYLNRWFRLQGNAIHESFDDAERAPIFGRATYWSYVGRLQFVL